ncbi:DUF6886 family protein [Paenibacillus herberti]|nr:DUF6886 family protein [Paenibacillus herberti]
MKKAIKGSVKAVGDENAGRSMKLYHFSEESSIETFIPRVKASRTNMPPVVWAIDEAHEFMFFVPRACPRIVYSRGGSMSQEDEERFFGHTAADRVMAVETGWLDRIMNVVLYRYELPSDSFELFSETAGYYISRETVGPLEIIRLEGLLERLAGLGIELRVTPNLHPLRNAIMGSTIDHFSIHQFANAKEPSH